MELNELKSIIAETIDIDTSHIDESSNFYTDLGLDSIEILQIVMALEEKYIIEIPTGDMKNLKSVGDAMQKINELINK